MPALKGLTSSRAFQRVYREGKGAGNRHISLRFFKRGDAGLRVGIVAGKEVGSAVYRNRAKRLLREACRLNQARIKEGYDLVVIARKDTRGLSYEETEEKLLELLGRARLLKDAK